MMTKATIVNPCCDSVHLRRRRRTFWERLVGIKEVYICSNCHKETPLK
ncbi:hypothetical protein QPB21_002322 [Vibrio alginolyticus]|nr:MULTISPECIES: hypothetical protein [Vibrio]MDW2064241.1 hypothetical protein [Vibrio sp. 1579]MDW2148682.1 hypothetical protein [Vibrio sp. 378]MDW2259088.1 hypothetical protein [Vibrio sp. 1409]EIL2909412.1 hypothetical protein [Vibrio alginolyticus]EIO9264004.1 hypothetical protein [Vibrio alginolyticus]